MPNLYKRLIIDGEKTGWTIDNVPERHKQATLKLLEQAGFDGYGKPL